jgi:hypothetical protein
MVRANSELRRRQNPLNRLHNKYFAIVPGAAEICRLAQFLLEGLLINDRTILIAMIITAKPRHHRSRLANFAADKSSFINKSGA